jgi:hypothetical protein
MISSLVLQVNCHSIYTLMYNQPALWLVLLACPTLVDVRSDNRRPVQLITSYRNPSLQKWHLFALKSVMECVRINDDCKLNVRGSVHHFIQKNPTRCKSVSKFIIPYLYEAQHVSGDTPPIIRSLKLH